MLSDEITTGGQASSDAAKKTYAIRSHEWNIGQSRFREAFPEVRLSFLLRYFTEASMLTGDMQYSGPTMIDLPNMGERDRGKPDIPPPPSPPPLTVTPAAPVVSDALKATSANNAAAAKPAEEASGAWGRVIWDRWRWGLFIALAVIVSRLTTGPK